MRTTFGLFQKYGDAKKAVAELMDKNFSKDEINVIAQKVAVEANWDVNERTVDVKATDEIGQKKVHGLDAMLGKQQPIQTSVAGDIYASGDMATVLARTASAPGAVDNGFTGALTDFGVAQENAEALAKGLRNGQLLIFVRSADERSSAARDVLVQEKADHITTIHG